MQSISWACCGLLVGWAVTAQLAQTKPQPIPPAPAAPATLQASNYQPPARPEFFPGP